jgi:hypothetical protein
VTSWGVLLLGAALFLGLARERPGFNRYAIAFAIVAAVILVVGARQHTL